MKYFDETAAYWGDSFEKIVLAGNNRLTVRSVKIFADGEQITITGVRLERLSRVRNSRRPSIGRCGGEHETPNWLLINASNCLRPSSAL